MDDKEFLTHIGQNQKIIHKICRLYRDTREDREDLFQEIYFQLWKSRASFNHDAKISTWIYRIAFNTAIATFRKKTHRVVYRPVMPEVAEEQPDQGLIIRQERLFAAMKQLNDADKVIMTLYLEDLPYQQISEITGITENYVGVKLNRIKLKIQQLLNN